MKTHLIKTGFIKDNIINDGNTFLLANGHIGYRGTLEEYTKEQLVSLNIVGVYDQYKDKWRESLNLPNPFFVKCFVDDKEISILNEEPLNHSLDLDLTKAVLRRETEFKDIIISSTRFVSHKTDSLLGERYSVKAKKDLHLSLTFGVDLDVYEINGPHYVQKQVIRKNNRLVFNGFTNEDDVIFLTYIHSLEGSTEYKESLFKKDIYLKKGEEISFEMFALVEEEDDSKLNIEEVSSCGFDALLKEHENAFFNKYMDSHVEIKGDEDADFEMRFSIYQLLCVGDENRCRGIPARGCSGQTYKGAIFWDSEMFLIPFFTLTNPIVARNSLVYRINTLKGAMAKAKEFNYEGAFYAWESQDTGLEACSKYNVTDPKTGEPIRTYFNEKQIHISADIVYAFDRYVKLTNDYSILQEGGLEVMYQCALFFVTFAKKVGDLWHILDVIGPDEYHERINDNAFTNYMAKHAIELAVKYLKNKKVNPNKSHIEDVTRFENFINSLYIPRPVSGVIEQFDGYFKLEDVTLENLKKRIKDPKEYWGGENGVASKTKIIKQADTCALVALLEDEFDEDVKKNNFEYYYPRTEHGSSLSSGMYSRLAFRLNNLDEAYKMFRKSASIDIVGSNKLYAGGIYIGGTHIASSGGAYLSLLYGCLGFKYEDGKIKLDPHLPKTFESLEFNITLNNKKYVLCAYRDGSYKVKER